MKVGLKSSVIDIDQKPTVDTAQKSQTAPKAEDMSADDMMNELFGTGEETGVVGDPFGGIDDYMIRAEDTGVAVWSVPDVDVIVERYRERFDREPSLSDLEAIKAKYEHLVYVALTAVIEEYTHAIESGDLTGSELSMAVQHRSEAQQRQTEGMRNLEKITGEMIPNKQKVHESELKAMWDLDGDGKVADSIGFMLGADGVALYYDLETGTSLPIIPNLSADPVAFKGGVTFFADEAAIPPLVEGEPEAHFNVQLDLESDYLDEEFKTRLTYMVPDTMWVKRNEEYGPYLRVSEEFGDYEPAYIPWELTMNEDGEIGQFDVNKAEYIQVQVAKYVVKDLCGKRLIDLIDKTGQLICRIAVHSNTTAEAVPFGREENGVKVVEASMLGFAVVDGGLLPKEYDFTGIESYTRHILSLQDSNLDQGEVASTFGLTPPEDLEDSGEYERRMRAWRENVNLFSGATYTADVWNIGKAADGTENDKWAIMEQTWNYGNDYDYYIDDKNDAVGTLIVDEDEDNRGLPEGCTWADPGDGDRGVGPVDTWRTGVMGRLNGVVKGSNYNDFIVMENERRQEHEDWSKFYPEAIDSDSPFNSSFYESTNGADFLVSHHGNIWATGVAFADVKTQPGGIVYLKEASGKTVGVKWNEDEEITEMPRHYKISYTVNSEGGQINVSHQENEVVESLDSNGVEGDNDKFSHWLGATYDDYYNVSSNASFYTDRTDDDDLNSSGVNVTSNCGLDDDIDQAMNDARLALIDEIQRIRQIDETDMQQQIDEALQGDFEAERAAFLDDFFGEVNNEWDSIENEVAMEEMEEGFDQEIV